MKTIPLKTFLISFLIFVSFVNVKGDPWFRLCPPPPYSESDCMYSDASGERHSCSEMTLWAWRPPSTGPDFYTREYQWQLYTPYIINMPWSNISGATTRDLTITSEGTYRCRVKVYQVSTLIASYLTDSTIVEFSWSLPLISGGTIGTQTYCHGDPATFTVISSGAFRTFQWYESQNGTDWTKINGETNSTYQFTVNVAKHGYMFKCRVRNDCGYAIAEREITLNVMTAPSITTHPSSAIKCIGNTLTLNAAASGTSPNYQWKKNGVNISGATSSTYINNNVQTGDAGNYTCYVYNTCGNDESNAATVEVRTPATFVTHPVNKTVCEQTTADFSVSVSGTSPVNKQWQKSTNNGSSWSDITGETSTSLSFTANASMHGNLYRCRINNYCTGDIYSDPATLNVDLAPSVTSDPVDKTICADANTAFSVSAAGTGLSYIWQESQNGGDNWTDLVDNAIYSNVTTQNLSITAAPATMNQYLYRCKVSGTCSPEDYSDTAILTVNTAPVIIIPPQNAVVCVGSNLILSVSAGGSEPLYYKWRKDGVLLSSDWQEDSTYVIMGLSSIHAGIYDVFVKNMCSSQTGIESDDATVTVNIPPSITAHPADVNLCEGSQPSVSFSTTVPGSGLSYQWEYSKDEGQSWTDLQDISPFSGVTTDEMTLSSTNDTLDQYLFRCKIIGVCDPPVTTNYARLTIKTAPEFIAHPEATEICEGEDVTFSVEVTGTEPYQYRWMKGGASITNWTTENSYTIFSATLDDIEKYKVLVKNECNSSGVSSEEAQLNVNPSPYISLGSDRHICTGESTIIDPGSGYASYMWSTGETTQSITVSDQGSYSVTVSDSKGCKNSDNIYIILDPHIPAIDLGEDSRYCSGESVLLDAGAGFDEYTWNDGSTAQTLPVYKTDTYYVTATRNNTVCVSTDTVNIIIAEPYDKEQICMITIDRLTGKNLVVWEKTPDKGIDEYQIWRETSKTDVYEQIGFSPVNALSVFRDDEADPEKQAYVYRITVTDTCGNISPIASSIYHKPLFLQYMSSEGGVKLRWDKYEMEKDSMEFITYEIYKGSDSTALLPVAQVSTKHQSYTDIDPLAQVYKYFYRVAGVRVEPCFPSGSTKADPITYSHSMSNLEDNRVQIPEGIDLKSAESLMIYPNPFHDRTTIRFTNHSGEPYKMILRNLSGQIVRITENITSTELILEKGNLKNGYYLLEISGREQVFRSKLVVE